MKLELDISPKSWKARREKLREASAKKEYTQSHMAELMGITREWYAYMEAGQKAAPLKRVVQVNELLKYGEKKYLKKGKTK